MSQVQDRLRLLASIANANAFVRQEATRRLQRQVTLDNARVLYLERITGTTGQGNPSPFFQTLQEGSAPSIPRIRQAQAELDAAIEQVLTRAEDLGIDLQE